MVAEVSNANLVCLQIAPAKEVFKCFASACICSNQVDMIEVDDFMMR